MTRTPRAIVLAGLLVAVATIAGCAEEAPPPVAPVPTGTTTPATAPAPLLADGSHFVLVRGIEGGALIVDPAEFLSGEEARNTAITDGFLAPGEDLPNDFYLRNTEEERVSLTVAEAATFTLIGFDATGGLVPLEIDAATFLLQLAGADASNYYGFVASELPLHIELQGGLCSVRIAAVRAVTAHITPSCTSHTLLHFRPHGQPHHGGAQSHATEREERRSGGNRR